MALRTLKSIYFAQLLLLNIINFFSNVCEILNELRYIFFCLLAYIFSQSIDRYNAIIYCKGFDFAMYAKQYRSIFFREKKNIEAVYLNLWLGLRSAKSFFCNDIILIERRIVNGAFI